MWQWEGRSSGEHTPHVCGQMLHRESTCFMYVEGRSSGEHILHLCGGMEIRESTQAHICRGTHTVPESTRVIDVSPKLIHLWHHKTKTCSVAFICLRIKLSFVCSGETPGGTQGLFLALLRRETRDSNLGHGCHSHKSGRAHLLSNPSLSNPALG